jgi:hypothetical protein
LYEEVDMPQSVSDEWLNEVLSRAPALTEEQAQRIMDIFLGAVVHHPGDEAPTAESPSN